MTDRPIRIQLSRKKGWRKPLNTVVVARPTKWGNPFKVADAIEVGWAKDGAGARHVVVECFRSWIGGSDRYWTGPKGEASRAAMLAAMPELRGKHLACWCRIDQPCHADVLLEIANR